MEGFTFISGATGGIGKAFSYSSAKRGYNLILTGRSEEKLNDLKDKLHSANGKITVYTFPADLSKEEDVDRLILSVRETGVKIKRIINVAGIDTQKAFLSYEYSKVKMQTHVNVNATVYLTYALLKLKTEDAEIITVSSMSGVSPMPYFALYSASKCMLTNFFTSLHYELKGEVKVTTVLPAGVYTRSDIIEEIKTQGLWGKLTAKTPEYVAEKSFKAVRKNKRILVIGFFSKLLYGLMKILPSGIVLRFISRRWKTHTKDAF